MLHRSPKICPVNFKQAPGAALYICSNQYVSFAVSQKRLSVLKIVSLFEVIYLKMFEEKAETMKSHLVGAWGVAAIAPL